MVREGKIIKIISNLYTVKFGDNIYECRARGKFRNDKITPLVGEFVLFDDEKNYITELLPRKNELKRPQVANIDAALVITSVKKPDLSLNLLDRELICIEHANVKPIICLTKLDLLNFKEKREIAKIFKYYKKIGYIVVSNRNLFKIRILLKNKLVVLTGQTGAGKSTLLNKLDKNLNLETNPISKALGRGVHTTRHVELFELGSMLIADTPGFSALDLSMEKDEIKNFYPEFKDKNCKFKECNHENEPNCEVKRLVVEGKISKIRYENYLKFRKE